MDTKRKFVEMLSGFDLAMLTTHCPNDRLSARPMAIADTDSDGSVWFVTDRDSGKLIDLASDPEVCVAMQDGKRFVSLSGRAKISDDRKRTIELWQDGWRVWFPDGPDDPSSVLIHVLAEQDAYWDNSGVQGIKYLVEAGKAYPQGTTLDKDSQINAKVSMDSVSKR
jgi:general stress protein 26